MKICSKCKRELPETLEFFFKRKNGKNGLMSYCKECNGFKFMKKITYNDEVKKCPSCKETFPYTNEYFSKSRHHKSGLSATCKSCIRSNSKKHYSGNKEQVDLKHREYYAKNKEAVCKRTYKYQKDNPDKYKVIWHRRRSRLKQLRHSFVDKEWEVCKYHFHNRCAYCGSDSTLTQEHFIPLALGGEYTKENIIPVCKSCNSSKQHRVFSEWYPKQSFYDEKREKKILKYLGYCNGFQQTALL